MGLYDAPSINKYKVGTFKGIDVSVPEDQQQPYRAADALNMIPDASGEVRKRPGVQREKDVTLFLNDGKYTRNTTIVGYYPGSFLIYRDQYDDYGVCLIGFADSITWIIKDVDKAPTVIPYGDKKIIFMQKGTLFDVKIPAEEYPYEAEGDFVNIGEEDFLGAMVIVSRDNRIAYTNSGHRYQYSFEDAVWYRARIKANDPYLTLPTILIGSAASGGGTPHQQINLLNPWVTESFCVTNPDGENTFYLQEQMRSDDERVGGSVIENDFEVEVLAEVIEDEEYLNEEGKPAGSIKALRWVKRSHHYKDGYRGSANRLYLSKEGDNTRYTIPGQSGYISMYLGNEYGNIPPTPKPGEDNVRITHIRADFSDEFIKLCKCVCGTTYGVGGYKDRLFLGGPGNTVYYSEMEDPFYIGALNYVHTEEGSKVMALDGTAGALSILTDKGIVLLSGQASTVAEDSYATDATFVVSHTLPAPEPIGYNNTAILGGEIVYLSKEGVVAIASKDNYAERYAEYRSALIDRKMLKDKPQRILNFGRYLLIFCASGICWLLDENQPNKDGNKPYAAHQYEGYRMDGFAADTVYIEGEALKLIRGDEIYRWTDGSIPGHYHDGKDTPIEAFWETPWIYGSNFYKNKIFMRLGVLLGELTDITTGQTVETNTGILVEGKKNDEDWKVFMNEEIVSRTFSFDRIDFRYLTFRGVAEMPAMTRKIKVKKAKRFKLRFSNNTVDQPFILREYGLDYVQED